MLFQSFVRSALDLLKAGAAEPVRYVWIDDAGETQELTAVPAIVGATALRSLGQRDVTDVQRDFRAGYHLSRAKDFLIDVADLSGLGRDPREGDRIHWQEKVWEVLPFGGEPEHRWADHQRTRYRIHTQQVE